MVGVGKGAQNGILVKNAEAIERAEKVTHLITDKTGTLTEGKPSVVDVQTANGVELNDLLRLAAAIESQSEHPLARAVVDKAKADGLTVPNITDFESTTGGGVQAKVDGDRIRIGKRSFVESDGVAIAEELGSEAERLQSEAKTVIWVAKEQPASRPHRHRRSDQRKLQGSHRITPRHGDHRRHVHGRQFTHSASRRQQTRHR